MGDRTEGWVGREGLQKRKKHVKEPTAEFFRKPSFLCAVKYLDESSHCGMIAPGTQESKVERDHNTYTLEHRNK